MMSDHHSEPRQAPLRPEPKPEWRRPVIERISLAATLYAGGSVTDGVSGSAV